MSERGERVAELFRTWDAPTSPGCAVGIVEGGRLTYARGFGQADLEHGVPISSSTPFHVASVSKKFTAFLVATLAREGKLALDDAVRRYLPELPDYGHRITIDQLIHHTSGLRDQWALLSLAGWREHDVVTNADVLDLAVRQRVLDFRPGDEFQYSNTGYTLLGVIVERVAGQSLRTYAGARIFRPLGMANSHFRDDHTELAPRRALGYVPTGDGYGLSVPAFATVGATSLWTTVEDLAAWVGNILDPRFGERDPVETMQTAGSLNDGSPIHYAFGLELGTYRGLRTVGHDGGDAGYRSYLGWFPDERFAVAILGNVSTLSPGRLARQVADVYLDGKLAAVSPRPLARLASKSEF